MELKSPLRLRLHLTSDCNQDCKFCYNTYHNKNEYITWEDFKLVSDMITDAEVFKISIGGGEPLLHPQFIEMYKYISERAFLPPIILTNGSTYDESLINKLVLLNASSQYGPLRVHVSLDSIESADGMHSSVSKTMEFIDRLIKSGTKPNIGCVVSKTNIDKIPNLVERYIHKTHFVFMPLMILRHNYRWAIENSPTQEQIEKLSIELNRLGLNTDLVREFAFDQYQTSNATGDNTCKGCSAAYTQLAIRPNLDVYACDIIPDIILGNLRKQSFTDIWQGNRARLIRSVREPICHDFRLIERLVNEVNTITD